VRNDSTHYCPGEPKGPKLKNHLSHEPGGSSNSDDSRKAESMTDELLTYQQAAELLQVHYSTIVRWTRPGRHGEPPLLKALKIAPRTVRIRRSDVERVLTNAGHPGENHEQAL